jgi:hypothetical protein
MINKIALFACMLFCNSLFSQSFNDILGKWQATEDYSKQVEFFKSAEGYIDGKALGDSQDKKMKAGQLIFQKCWFDEGEKNWKGTMRPPGSSIEVNATFSIEKDGKLKVVIRKFLMSKTMYFNKTT